MSKEACQPYSRFAFRDATGYVVTHPQGLIAIGHTASISPWRDPYIHRHTLSEEYYFLRKGQLEFLVDDFQLTLHSNEILMVKPTVPHAILGGTGPIEHLGIRASALGDKRIVGELRKDVPHLDGSERLISGEWGHRIPLGMVQHQNCWLMGWGTARYPSQYLIMAYMDFPTKETANAHVGTRNHLHLHQRSWEYFVVLDGEEIQAVEGTSIAIHAGEILEIPPNVKHNLQSRQAPYRGFTLRVPVELDDKIEYKDE